MNANNVGQSGIKSEHKAPGENSVVRLVVMESGTRHVYYKDKLVGSIGDDDSLVATLEGLVDETWDRSGEYFKKQLIEEISKPEFLRQLQFAGFAQTVRELAVAIPRKRKKFLGIF